MSDFAKSLREFKKKTLERVDHSIIESTRSLFLTVIQYSPIADERYEQTRGTFVHSWNAAINQMDTSSTHQPSPNKAAAIQRMNNVLIAGIFLKGDAYISFTNNAGHASRVEYRGWPANEGWIGDKGYDGNGSPYRPVARAVQAFKLLV